MRKCPYCHFYSVLDNESLKDRFVEALCREIDQWKEQIQKKDLVSLYFGGGTPFLFGATRLSKALNSLTEFCSLEQCEITIEANPETTTLDTLRQYHALGINRLSIGAQSFNSDHLRTLHRRHTPDDTRRVLDESLKAGFSNISLDLMYDLPGLTTEAWRQTLHETCSLPIQHLSLYNLTIEPATAWFRKKATIEALMPNEEISLQMYESAQEIAEQHSFHQYEISAFAQEGKHSHHNVGYWQGHDFIGFGPSAFSFFGGKRFSNISNLIQYCECLEQNRDPVNFIEEIEPSKRLREMVAIGLRMNEGICVKELEATWGPADQSLLKSLHHLETIHLLEKKKDLLALTQKGRLVYDSIAVELI